MVLKPDPITAGYDSGIDGVPVNIVQSKASPSGTVVSGTKTCPATASNAEVIVASQACSEVTIQAPETNTVTVLFGSATGTCYMRLMPGRDFTIPISNVNLLFCKSPTASATEVINYIARA